MKLAFWVTLPVVVLDMILITCEGPSFAVWEVHLHDGQYEGSIARLLKVYAFPVLNPLLC